MPSGGSEDTPTLSSLRNVKAFATLPDAVLDELAPLCRFVHFNKGHEIFVQGGPPDCFYALTNGTVKLVTASPTGKDVMLHLVFSNELLGAVVAIKGKPFPATAVALRRTMAIRVPVRDFLAVCGHHGEGHQAMLGHVIDRVSESHSFRAMQGEPVPVRLAHLLHVLALRDGAQGKWLPLTKRELGTLINATTETCIRILSQWEKDGIVQSARGKLRVLAPQRLQAIVNAGE